MAYFLFPQFFAEVRPQSTQNSRLPDTVLREIVDPGTSRKRLNKQVIDIAAFPKQSVSGQSLNDPHQGNQVLVFGHIPHVSHCLIKTVGREVGHE